MYISVKRGMYALILCMLVIATVVVGTTQPAHAAGPRISVESEIGYNGSYKMNKWTPLTITLKSDEDISGEVVVQVEIPYSGSSQTYVKKVDLPAGTAKQVTFGIIGNSFNKNNNSIRFYKGSAEAGKNIAFASGEAYLQTAPLGGAVIGQLASDPDSLNFINLLNNRNNPINVLALAPEQMPEDAAMLSSLDVLFLNNFASDTLEEGKKQAISTWVHQGGTLVLAGGPSYLKTVKGLESLSPVEYSGTMDISSLPEMEKLANKELKLDHTISISTAQLKSGADSVINAQGEPLIASWSLGKGKVFYAAYDLAAEPVHSWGGHADFWNSLLQSKVSGSVMDRNNGTQGMKNSLDNYLSYFPSLALPPFSLFFWLLVGYAVLVAPVLYYVLKRFDRREWAWFLIPLIAIITSVSIYVTGTSGKSSLQAHMLNVVELDGQGQGEQLTASALFVPRGGNYEFEIPGATHVTSKREDGYISGGGEEGISRQLIREQVGNTTVYLKDMTHRSMAKLWIEQQTGSFGSLDIEIALDTKGVPQGNVTNRLDRDLSDAALILGGNIFVLGELAKDQTVQIPANYTSSTNGSYSSILFPYPSGPEDEKNRERGMMNSLLEQNTGSMRNMLIAWSKDSFGGYTVNGKNPATDQLNMWVQPVTVQFTPSKANEIDVPYGYIPAQITSVSTMGWGRTTAQID
ncbi:hypothetical protein RE628_21675 [Paenibacillus sp. D2_2]|uniref:DUF7408 domain-containing protein n=1 Tax=Paenibacillus sp. D2_2 TaxID=3073092 RepID=UPI0028153DB9|nr:hypothetical protein [Paenibacillus sp. D2_2]WMT39930.1 hypothetical protein RE628_21675 [Paenibacillus sp. D2_2]